jgi:hypothetical protein
MGRGFDSHHRLRICIMKNTRLKRRQVQKTKQHVLLIIVGTIVLIGLLVVFGVPLLVNLSLLVGKLKTDTAQDLSGKSPSYIAPPLLDETFSATNSAEISVSGSAEEKQVIKIYVNDEFIDEVSVDDEKRFTFENIQLTAGANEIEVIAKEGKNESSYSDPVTITYLKEPPKLDVSYPTDKATIARNNNPMRIQGTTDPDVKVTINNFWAIMESDGDFYYDFPLKDGENKLLIVAIDEAGNKTEKELTVSLAQ